MFGYITPYKPELKLMEYETYRAVYCGLCKQLGREFGLLSRMTLSYDFAFLALLELSLGEERPCFAQERCLVHPLRRHSCCQSAQNLTFSANVAMILLYQKLLDNVQDRSGIKRLGAQALKGLYGRACKKAAAKYPQVQAFAQKMMEQQRQLESALCDSVDRASEPTAQCLGSICALLSQEEGQQRVLRRMGYLLGRWIYLMDALDDLQEDAKQGSYNAFLLANGVKAGQAETPCWQDIRERARGSLYLTVGELCKTFDLLEVQRYGTILANILYLGLRERTRQLVEGNEGGTDLPAPQSL